MSWNPLDTPQDYAVVAGKKTPGILRLTSPNSPRKWDERNGYGLSGATLVFTGLGLSEFDCNLELYTPADWLDWDAFRPIVAKPPPRTRPKALDFAHPLTAQAGIKSVVVLDMYVPELSDDTGIWTAKIKLKEFRRPRIALAKPDGATQSASNDPIDIQLDKNNAVIGGLLDSLSK